MTNSIFKRIALILPHIKTLRQRKVELDGKIAHEQSRLAPDYQQLHWLKVRRLMIQDQLRRYDVILQNLKATLTNSNARKVGVA
ncbi:hypothetical protein [uncultured Shimia sp.]|uniref:hypothetical protein n=1 Tax=uncultured Shimia sp. TaxID=573152 RepID=UPI002638C6D1|nr:hypothetical protein [uncultured Shimia sp.]